jgi:hypothetical protein
MPLETKFAIPIPSEKIATNSEALTKRITLKFINFSCKFMWHFVEIVLLAFLASCLRTLSAYHFEPNAIILIKIGIASFHFAVNVHRTIFGDLCSSVRLISPDFSNSESQ